MRTLAAEKWLALILLFQMAHSGAAPPQSVADFHPGKVYERSFYVDSNLEFTVLHELAHAVIDINRVPVLGGQESAADPAGVILQ
ncbi:MAG: hypothetical protein KDI17_06750 [Halioglobus sp.]|nr:hypothetical protein [Halioglobus sp.]